LSRPPITKHEPDTDDIVSFITEDALGKIWIGTLDNGIARYDPQTKKTIHYDLTRDSTSLMTQGDYSSWCAFNSGDGALWIGTFLPSTRPTSSLYRVDPFKKNIPYFRLGTDANSFFEDDNGNLWLATTDDGLIRNNKSGGKKGFSPGAGDAAGIISESVNVVRPARGGRLWIGTFKGLKDFDPGSGIFTRYQPLLITIAS
jgi:ligand-binding sensor domain-containing protein